MNPCTDSLFYATQGATYFFDLYKEKLKAEFEKAYTAKCLDAGRLESFTVTHPVTEYHYTLYYYDQAGNLVKTVPPEGVHPVRRDTWMDSVTTFRDAALVLRPSHTLATTYRFNSLNQVISQHSPDGGLSKFWYDRLGRLSVSQNAQQLIGANYSYTLYDSLGRITEVGQKMQVTPMTDGIARSPQSLKTWLGYTYTLDATTVIAEQVTRTVYDTRDPETAVLPSSGYVVNRAFQKAYTLRNRVSHTRFYEKLGWNSSAPLYSDYDNSSLYSYDIHGNVDTLLHHYRTGMMADNHGNNQFKAMAYRHDLLSGKVNEVHYQPGMADQFYHRYEYDADNRLTDVYTTDRKQLLGIPVLEEHEARYNYYKHGPLAKVVLGQQLVQGMDYAYTLQGWLKGVNSDSLLDGDGKTGSIVGKDAYRFSLNYFNNDYYAIGQSVTSAFPGYSAFMGSDHKPLYNGNISSMVVGVPKLGETRLNNYAYDQLHRIVKMDSWKGYNTATLSWSGMSKTDEWKERISYDANGNILKYLRNGHAGQLNMDSLTYQYNRDGNGNLTNNRLRHVDDIDWTVYGKIRKITKADGTVISYTYDVSGNRISKTITGSPSGAGGTTWYARDAQGNPMAIYSGVSSSLKLSEHQLYGSSRLGVWNRNIDMDAVINPDNYIFTRGKKFFELSNHLGNVLVTISDRKTGYNAGNGTYDYYDADVVTATDYYPFGMGLVGRKYQAGNSYRYGFGGQEKSNEIKGEGNSYTAEYWEYDPRLGRRWNIDPIDKEYESPYATFGNNPIWNVDFNGADTAKYLSSSQILDAVKLAYNIINDDVKANKYNARKDKSTEISNAFIKYFKEHQSDLNTSQKVIEFKVTLDQYFKGFIEVASANRPAWDRVGERLNNSNISDEQNILHAATAIHAYNGTLMNVVTQGANVAMGTAAGGVGIRAGGGPRAPAIISQTKFSDLAKNGFIDPAKIRFSQNSISSKFQDGTKVSNLITRLKNGASAQSIPAIRIVEKDGLIYTLDNRRLYAFQQAGVAVRYEKLNVIPKRESYKFTTTNQGASIEVRP